MKNTAISLKATGVALLAGGLAVTAYAAAGTILIINGKVASTSVRTINGVAYVKVADVAQSMGMVVVKRSDGYEITRAGGAGQVNGIEGKIGDQLFDGRWRFKATGVEQVSTYALKTGAGLNDSPSSINYSSITHILDAKPGSTLILIHCTIANGQKTKQTLWTWPHDSTTALTDTNGESYPPIVYDFDGAPIQTKPLLPGAKMDIPVLFCVPQGTDLKDLVFFLRNSDSSAKDDVVRVSLQ